MHELAICKSISRIGLRACDGRRALSVTVDVGALRQVVPAALTQCWGFVTTGTKLAGSALVVNEIPAVIACLKCQTRTTLRQPFMVCDACGATDVAVITGRELLVRSIDVETDAQETKE